MKILKSAILTLGFLSLHVGCNDPGYNQHPPAGNFAALPGPTSQCLQFGPGTPGCQNQQFANPGWQPYPAAGYGQNFVQSGFNSCGGGSFPVLTGSGPAACVNGAQFQGGQYAHATVNPQTMGYQVGGTWSPHSAFIACSPASTDQFGQSWSCPPGYYCEPANGNPQTATPGSPFASSPMAMGMCRKY
jgi:hypothetical protein